jgi:hypothetical protein
MNRIHSFLNAAKALRLVVNDALEVVVLREDPPASEAECLEARNSAYRSWTTTHNALELAVVHTVNGDVLLWDALSKFFDPKEEFPLSKSWIKTIGLKDRVRAIYIHSNLLE